MTSFQPFGASHAQSSHLQTPEATPLRKRENDSFSSPEIPLLWRQPLQSNGVNHHNNYGGGPHYAEVNFAPFSRRKGRHFNNAKGPQFWIPWVMRGILASPLVVLLLWTVCIAVRHPTQSSQANNHRFGRSNVSNPRNLMQQQFQQQQQPNSILLAPAAGRRQQHLDDSNNNNKIFPVYVPMGQSQQQQQMQLQQKPNLMASSNGNGNYANQVFLEDQQQQPNMLISQTGNSDQLLVQPSGLMMAGNMDSTNGMVESQQQMMQQGRPQMQKDQPLQQLEQPQQMQQEQSPQMTMQAQPSMTSTHSQRQNQRPAHPSRLANLWGSIGRRGNRAPQMSAPKQQQQQPKVYYYDPQQAVVGGRLQAPSMVYDVHGQEVLLASLSSPNTEVLLEPPSMDIMAAPAFGAAQPGSRRRMGSVSVASDSSNGTLPLPPPPDTLQLSQLKTPESWGESSAQDQSIIVCTVAVMALLVGALSARRMRARSFLSSCIENESLEDEVRFDTAYTIAGSGDSYNTFGWKGDLEKFDV